MESEIYWDILYILLFHYIKTQIPTGKCITLMSGIFMNRTLLKLVDFARPEFNSTDHKKKNFKAPHFTLNNFFEAISSAILFSNAGTATHKI